MGGGLMTFVWICFGDDVTLNVPTFSTSEPEFLNPACPCISEPNVSRLLSTISCRADLAIWFAKPSLCHVSSFQHYLPNPAL